MENAIKREFGEDFPQTSDSFHFKQNAVQMLSSEIGNTNNKQNLKFVHSLQEATTLAVYNGVHKRLNTGYVKNLKDGKC